MNSRPLLDYLTSADEHAERDAGEMSRAASQDARAPVAEDTLEARLAALAARLKQGAPPRPTSRPEADLTLSAQIEAILGRTAPPRDEDARSRPPRTAAEHPVRRERVVVAPPPTVPALVAAPAPDPEFAKFSEAVYLIGQAAKRFVDQPAPARAVASVAPSTADIDALSAVLRETMSAFRSVADDIAVSAGEIRAMATRDESVRQASRQAARAGQDDMPDLLRETVTAFQAIARELAASVSEIRAAARGDDRIAPSRRDRHPSYRHDEDEILDLRDSVADLQDRLGALLQGRRRARY